jgi:hypothetical protein
MVIDNITGLKRYVLPNSKLPVVIAAENNLQAQKEKIDTRISEKRSIHNRIEVELDDLFRQKIELFGPRNTILSLFTSNADVAFSSKDVHRLLGIPLRTVQYQIRTMIEQGLLFLADNSHYQIIKQTGQAV